MFNHDINHLFLDMDGVLADFDKAAIPLFFGAHPEDFERENGQGKFWKRINSDKNFFRNLELMNDALELYNAVKHLKPTILTGIPGGMDPHGNQKHDWALQHFGPKQKVICCKAKEKSNHCNPGDVLVDDRIVYKHLWEEKGGVYIVHTSAKKSLEELKKIGVI